MNKIHLVKELNKGFNKKIPRTVCATKCGHYVLTLSVLVDWNCDTCLHQLFATAPTSTSGSISSHLLTAQGLDTLTLTASHAKLINGTGLI